MATRKTLEEKELLIKDFKSSGLTMKKWCKAYGISPSTFRGWMCPENQGVKTKEDVRFIEISPPVSETVTTADTTSSIIIKCNCVEIEINSNTDMLLLSNIIKVVKSVNV